MPVSRLIRLRRPPTIRAVAEPFVPRGVAIDEVDRRWQGLCAANPAYHDGRLLHVFGVHRNGHGGATIHVAECAYRFHAVSHDGLDAGVRPLGVKGLVFAPAGAGDAAGLGDALVLVGRRSARVAYAGMWEFAPGGGVEPGTTPEQTFRRELFEETGLSLASECATAPRPPAARAILFDGVVRSWEIVMALWLRSRPALPARSAEYDALRWLPAAALVGHVAGRVDCVAAPELDAPLAPAALAMVPLMDELRREQAGGAAARLATQPRPGVRPAREVADG